jgi:kynurenine formamidase
VSSTGNGNWGRWGAEDQRGALNLVTPERVVSAAQRCRTGKVYSLALSISQRSTPTIADRPAPERLTLSGPGDEAFHQRRGAAEGVGANEDVIVIPSHAGTHMDALSHVYAEGTIYNGHASSSFTPRMGASRCSIEQTGTVAARAVLLDLAGHAGVPHLEPGHAVTAAELEACRSAQGVDLVGGDALLVRTGWIEAHLGPNAIAPYPQPGLGLDAVQFVRDHDVALVGADNAAIEVLPFDRGVYLGVHIELLIRLGVTLVEHLWLAELAGDRCYESLLVIGALPVVGATGSPVNPIAIG